MNINISIGKKEKSFLNSEINSRKFARRSLIARKLIKKNQIIQKKDLICKDQERVSSLEKLIKL